MKLIGHTIYQVGLVLQLPQQYNNLPVDPPPPGWVDPVPFVPGKKGTMNKNMLHIHFLFILFQQKYPAFCCRKTVFYTAYPEKNTEKTLAKTPGSF